MSLNSPDSSTLQYGAGRCLLCLCVITSSIQFTHQVSLYTVARNGEISVHCLSSSSCRVFASKYCRSRMIWNHTIITSHAVTHCSVLFAARCYSMQARPMLSCGVCQCVCVCVCPSRSHILSKRINISSKFLHHRVVTPL